MPCLTILQIVTLHFFLRFQAARRRSRTVPLPIYPIRNIYYEWNLRLNTPLSVPLHTRAIDYSRTLFSYIDLMTCANIRESIQDSTDSIFERYITLDEPFNLHTAITLDDIPADRLPNPGLRILPLRYHSISPGLLLLSGKETFTFHDPFAAETPDSRESQTQINDETLTGAPPHPAILEILYQWFPMFLPFLSEYCRPPSYGPQAFLDFNRTTELIPDPSPQRLDDIMTIINNTFNITPYRPLHFVDALAANTPLSTSASYFDKFDTATKTYSRYSTPTAYATKSKSKGFSFNPMMNTFRLQMHQWKYTLPSQSEMIQYFSDHPTQLFIRSQISKRDPALPKKIRPVYSVDARFLHMEKMLTTNFLAQMRNPQCCVLHGLETFRGSMSFIDQVAHSFNFYVSLDWSQFDQRLPLPAIKAYYTRYLPSLLIVSHGYFPSRGYENTLQPTDSFAIKIFNILHVLYSWYRNMVFLSYDGFAYTRLNGGVPSGLLNTQSLDSFGNMFILADCLLEFGFTIEDTKQMIFFILGDDNIFFGNQHFDRICAFMAFLDSYARKRHGMVLSILKSLYTKLRSKIEILGYQNNYGMPTRPLSKLVAQLAYPERPIPFNKEWQHAARALGLAYAACGQSHSFHLLCKMVYDKFRPDTKIPLRQFNKISKYTVSELLGFNVSTDDMITFPDFPSLTAIRTLVSYYHGPFSEQDKWPETLFEDTPPSDNLTEYITLYDWLQLHPEHSFDSTNFMPGYDAPDALSIAFSALTI
jgi:hypothetical protein